MILKTKIQIIHLDYSKIVNDSGKLITYNANKKYTERCWRDASQWLSDHLA